MSKRVSLGEMWVIIARKDESQGHDAIACAPTNLKQASDSRITDDRNRKQASEIPVATL